MNSIAPSQRENVLIFNSIRGFSIFYYFNGRGAKSRPNTGILLLPEIFSQIKPFMLPYNDLIFAQLIMRLRNLKILLTN